MKYTPSELLLLKNANVISESEYNKRLNELNPQSVENKSSINDIVNRIENADLEQSTVSGVIPTLTNRMSTAFGDELPKGLLTAGKALGLGSKDWYNEQIAQQQAEADKSLRMLTPEAQQSTTAQVGDIVGGISSNVLPTLLAGAVGSLAGPVGALSAATAVGTAIGAGQDTAEFEQRKRQELEARNATLPPNEQLNQQQIQAIIDSQTTGQFGKAAALEGVTNLAGLGIASKIGKQSLKYLPTMGKAAAIDAPLGAVSGALSEQIIGSGLEGGANADLATEKAILGGLAGGALSGGFAGLEVRGQRAAVTKEAEQGKTRLAPGEQEFAASNPLVEDIAKQRLEFLNKKETGNVSYELRDVFNANGELVKNRKQIFGIIKQEQPQTQADTTVTPDVTTETQPADLTDNITTEKTQEIIGGDLFAKQEDIENPEVKKQNSLKALNEISNLKLEEDLSSSDAAEAIKEILVNNGLNINDINTNIDIEKDALNAEQISGYQSLKKAENSIRNNINDEDVNEGLGWIGPVKKSSYDFNNLDENQSVIKTENLNKDNTVPYIDKDTSKPIDLINAFKQETNLGKSPKGVPLIEPITVNGKTKIKEGKTYISQDADGNTVVSTYGTLKSFLDENIANILNTYNYLSNDKEINLVFNNKSRFTKKDNVKEQVGAVEVWSGKNKIGIILNPDVGSFVNDSVRAGYADTVRVGFVWESLTTGKKTYSVKVGNERYRPKIVVQYTLPKDKSINDATFKAIEQNNLTDEMLNAKPQTKEEKAIKQPTAKQVEAKNKKEEAKTKTDNVKKLYDMVLNDTYKGNKEFDDNLSKYATKQIVNNLSKGNNQFRNELKNIIKENNPSLYDNLFSLEDAKIGIADKNKKVKPEPNKVVKEKTTKKVTEPKVEEIKTETKTIEKTEEVKVETQPKEVETKTIVKKEEPYAPKDETGKLILGKDNNSIKMDRKDKNGNPIEPTASIEKAKKAVDTIFKDNKQNDINGKQTLKEVIEYIDDKRYVDKVLEDYGFDYYKEFNIERKTPFKKQSETKKDIGTQEYAIEDLNKLMDSNKELDTIISQNKYKKNDLFNNFIYDNKDTPLFVNQLSLKYGQKVGQYAQELIRYIKAQETIQKDANVNTKQKEVIKTLEEDYGIYANDIKKFDEELKQGKDVLDYIYSSKKETKPTKKVKKEDEVKTEQPASKQEEVKYETVVSKGKNGTFITKQVPIKSELAKQKERETILKRVKSNGSSLFAVAKEYRNDKEVVLEAVKKDGTALQYASPELQNDKEVVLEAVKKDGIALEYASPELQNDKEVVLEAVKQYGGSLYYASKELQNDREVVLTAVKQHGIALKYASEDLRNDREVVLEAVKTSLTRSNINVAKHASEELKNKYGDNNKDFIINAERAINAENLKKDLESTLTKKEVKVEEQTKVNEQDFISKAIERNNKKIENTRMPSYDELLKINNVIETINDIDAGNIKPYKDLPENLQADPLIIDRYLSDENFNYDTEVPQKIKDKLGETVDDFDAINLEKLSNILDGYQEKYNFFKKQRTIFENSQKQDPINVQNTDNNLLSAQSLLQKAEENSVLENIKDENIKEEYASIEQDLSSVDKKIRAEKNLNAKKVKEVKGSSIDENTTIDQLKKEADNEGIINSIKSRIELMQKGDTVVPNVNIVFDYKGKKHSNENNVVVNKIKSQKQKNVAGALYTDENGSEHIYLNIENIKKLIETEPQFKGMNVNDYAEYVYSHETGHTKINKLFDNDEDFNSFVNKNAKGKILQGLFELKRKDYPGVSDTVIWKEVFSDFLGGKMLSADRKGNIKVKSIADFVEEFKNYKTSDAKALLNIFKNAINDITGKKIFKAKTEGDNIKSLMEQFQKIAESKSDYTNSKRDSQIGKNYAKYLDDLAKIEYSLFPTSVLSAAKETSLKQGASVLGDFFVATGKSFSIRTSRALKQADIRASSDEDFARGYKVNTDMENMLEQLTKTLDIKVKRVKDFIQLSRKDKEAEKSLINANKVFNEIRKNISKNKEIPSYNKLITDYKLTINEAQIVDDLLNVHITGQKNKKKAELINIGNEEKLISDYIFDNKFRNIDEYSIDELYNYLTKEVALQVNKYDKLQGFLSKKIDNDEVNKLKNEVEQLKSKEALLSIQKRLDSTFKKSKEFEIIQVPHGSWYINVKDKSIKQGSQQIFFEQYSNDIFKYIAEKRIMAKYKDKDRYEIEVNKIDRSASKLNDPNQKVNKHINEWTENPMGGFDFFRNSFNSIDELSRQTAVLMYNERIENIADDLSNNGKGDIAIEIKKIKDNILRREGNILSSIRGATSVLTLGFNLASAAINLSNLGLILPASANRYGALSSYKKAISLFTDKELLKVLWKGNDEEAFNYIVKKIAKTPTEAATLKDLYFSGLLLGTGNYDIKAARKAIDSTKLTRGIERYVDLSMKPFSLTEKMNRVITTAMFMDIASRQNITNRNEMRLFVRDNIHKTQGNYNKSGRPSFLGGDFGALIWQFKQFPHAIIGKFLSTGIGALKGNKDDLKEFAPLLLAYIMFAGIKGLPLVDDIDDLYNGISKHAGNYDADLKGSIKETLSNNALTKLLYEGLFSADTGLGMIDISQNLSLAKFTPGLGALDPTNKDRFKTLWEVLGPSATKITSSTIDLIDGVSNLSMYQTLRALPISGVNNFLQGTGALLTDNYLNKSEKAQVSTGNEFEDKYIAPFFKIAGFNPSRLTKTTELVTDSYTISGNKKYATQNANRKAAEGDLAGANKILKDWNSRYPNNKIKLDNDSIEKIKKNINLENDAFDRFTQSSNKDLAKIVKQKQQEAGLED